jgi:tRNA (mo5U34)-methyltransferase
VSARRTPPSPEAAREFIEGSSFVWHQRFELVPGVWTPGSNAIPWLAEQADLPADLSGLSALDVGTTNAGTAFELERRGAQPVVAVDIFDPDWFGVRELKRFLGSEIEYVRGSVYELEHRLSERFDVVIFWGVLYHLRHPLLALDNLRAVTRGFVSLETAVCDHELKRRERRRSLARFYRGDELAGDASNWFAPTVAGLEEWCASAGFEVTSSTAWPTKPERALLTLVPTPGTPEFEAVSYERPLRCEVPSADRSSSSR